MREDSREDSREDREAARAEKLATAMRNKYATAMEREMERQMERTGCQGRVESWLLAFETTGGWGKDMELPDPNPFWATHMF